MTNTGIISPETKRTMLREPHVAALTDYMTQIRSERGPQAKIPDFDPCDGGVQAEALLVMEAPGPKAVHTGFVSCDNPDQTARNLKRFMEEAGLARRQCALWNIVPWHLSDGLRNLNPHTADVQAGRPYLCQLIALMPRLRAVVLVGRKAQSVAVQLPHLKTAHVFACPHPSPQYVNRQAGNDAQIVAALREVATYLNG